MRRALAATFVAASLLTSLAACSSKAPPPPKTAEEPITHAPEPAGEGKAPNPDDVKRQERLIAKMLKKVSAVRALAATKDVPGKVMSRDALLARVKAHVAREVPTEAIKNEGMVLQLLGFVPMEFNYEAATFKLLEAQLAGFYEPADGTMYMAGDLDGDNARATLAHELVHALQDMHFGLGPRSKYKPGQGDQSTATSSLAEGDATSAMLDVLLDGSGRTALDIPEDIFSEQVMGSINSGPGADAPHAMRASLVAPYVDGTRFVHALRRRGGWKEVDRVWEAPPTTSEQILHLDKYDAHEPPIPVADLPLADLGAGFTAADTDTYGELGVRLAFEEWIDLDKAAKAAEHWGGDRIVLAKKDDVYALGWKIRYDAGTAANEGLWATKAFAPIATGLEAKVGPAKDKDPAPGEGLCIERAKLGPLLLIHRGRDLVIVAGPTKTNATGDWSSAGNCAAARKWAAAIAK